MKLPVRMRTEAKDLKNTLMALPFAKAEDIAKVYEEIDDNISLALRANEKVQNFLRYFKGTWLSETRHNFKPEDFSVYGQPDRTNNHIESFHSRLHLVKPNIWIFLRKY